MKRITFAEEICVEPVGFLERKKKYDVLLGGI